MKLITTLGAIILHCVVISQEWTTFQTNEYISIEYARIDHVSKSDGIHHQRIIFKYTNLTDSDLELSFQRLLTYNAKNGELLQEKTYSVSLPAQGSVQYNQTNSTDKTFYIFYKDLGGTIKSNLANFEIVHLEYK